MRKARERERERESMQTDTKYAQGSEYNWDFEIRAICFMSLPSFFLYLAEISY